MDARELEFFLIGIKMPLLAMFMARLMMIVAVVGSVSMYFYLYIIRYSPLFTRQQTAYVPPPPFQWDRADRRNVIIVTDPVIIDSNILGRVFNQHPRVFYLEQPLYPFEMFKTLNYTHESKYSGQVRAFLDNLFHCRFHGYKDYLTFMSHPGLASPRYRLSSKALSSPPLCKQEIDSYTSISNFLEICPILQPQWVSNVCASKMHVVISMYGKRAPGGGLTGLISLMTSESMATRVVYLVRDPRANVWDILSGAVKSKRIKDDTQNHNVIENKIKHFCNEMERNIDFSESLPWELRNQYHVIRYEEVVENVSQASDRAFKFAEIDRVESVNDFVKNQAQKLTSYEQELSWRLKIHMDVVFMVEQHCARAMRILGYKTLGKDESELRNLENSLLTTPQTRG